MAKVLIVYHSITGNTEEMARAVAEGAKSVAGTKVTLKKAADANADDLLSCDVAIFGTSTNFGYISGGLKDFFDRTLTQCQNKTTDKPYCAFTSSGMGKKRSLEVIDGLAIAYKMKKVDDGIMAQGKATPETMESLRQLGKKMAQAAAKK
jgi:multimeric flavodoxin WrbA